MDSNSIRTRYISRKEKFISLDIAGQEMDFHLIYKKILQEENPIYFASRSLNPTEKNYQNLEWECMTAIWGMEKFHFYLYGKEFLLQTDQKPLTSIFKKHLVNGIRRIAIRSWL